MKAYTDILAETEIVSHIGKQLGKLMTGGIKISWNLYLNFFSRQFIIGFPVALDTLIV